MENNPGGQMKVVRGQNTYSSPEFQTYLEDKNRSNYDFIMRGPSLFGKIGRTPKEKNEYVVNNASRYTPEVVGKAKDWLAKNSPKKNKAVVSTPSTSPQMSGVTPTAVSNREAMLNAAFRPNLA